MLAILVPLLFAAQQPLPDIEPIENVEALIERNALEGAFVEIYKPYTAARHTTPPWEFPIYSAETTALLAQWRSVAPAGEPDALSDGDWLCQCQDWDAASFTATITATPLHTASDAQLDIAVDLGVGPAAESTRKLRLVLKREEGTWELDDVVAPSLPGGLKQALREAIAAGGAPSGERG